MCRIFVLVVALTPSTALLHLAPAAHAIGVGLASLHALAVTSFHAGGAAHAAGAAIHAASGAKVGSVVAAGTHASLSGAAATAAGTHASLSGAAATAAGTHASLSGAAATGALTAAPTTLTAGTRVLTDELRRPERSPSAKAVGRIIQIEVDRLKEAAFQGNPYPPAVIQRVQERLTERGPIIMWSLDVWLEEHLAKLPGYRQVAQARVPRIWSALRALEVELTSQIKFGLTTAPWRVLQLAYSSLVVVVVALLGRMPWLHGQFKETRLAPRLRSEWPELVEHLAATLETNLRRDPSRVVVSTRARSLGSKWRALFPLCERVRAFLPSSRRPAAV